MRNQPAVRLAVAFLWLTARVLVAILLVALVSLHLACVMYLIRAGT